MKSLFYCAVFLLSLINYGCSDTSNTPQIYGKWHDLSDHPARVVKNGVETEVTFPNIFYTFFQNGSYTVNGEIEIGVVADGNFELSNNDQKVTFITNLSIQDSIIGINRSFEWDILELEENYMKVNYHYYSTIVGVQIPIDITIEREFERIE